MLVDIYVLYDTNVPDASDKNSPWPNLSHTPNEPSWEGPDLRDLSLARLVHLSKDPA